MGFGRLTWQRKPQIFIEHTRTKVNVARYVARPSWLIGMLYYWGFVLCSCFSNTSQRSIFTSLYAFCARTIIIITDTAGLLLPTIKCRWENSVQILDWKKKSNLSGGSYHLLFNAVMAKRPEGKKGRKKTGCFFSLVGGRVDFLTQGNYMKVCLPLTFQLSHDQSQTSKSSLQHQILSRVPCLHLFLGGVACSIYIHCHRSSWDVGHKTLTIQSSDPTVTFICICLTTNDFYFPL